MDLQGIEFRVVISCEFWQEFGGSFRAVAIDW
jgi:hypothetical protein